MKKNNINETFSHGWYFRWKDLPLDSLSAPSGWPWRVLRTDLYNNIIIKRSTIFCSMRGLEKKNVFYAPTVLTCSYPECATTTCLFVPVVESKPFMERIQHARFLTKNHTNDMEMCWNRKIVNHIVIPVDASAWKAEKAHYNLKNYSSQNESIAEPAVNLLEIWNSYDECKKENKKDSEENDDDYRRVWRFFRGWF